MSRLENDIADIANAEVRSAIDSEIARALDAAVDEHAQRIVDRGTMPAFPDVVGEGPDFDSWNAGDWAATIFTGGAYGVIKAADQASRGGSSEAGAPSTGAQSSAYQADVITRQKAAVQASRDSRAANEARMALLKSTPRYAPVQTTVPSFELEKTRMFDLESLVGELLGVTKKPPPIRPKVVTHSPIPRGTGPRKGINLARKAAASTANAAKRARTAGTHAATRAATYKPAQHRTLIPLKQLATNPPGERVVLGTDKPLTPAQSKAIAKHVDRMRRHAAAVKVAKVAADRALKAAASLEATHKRYAGVLDKLITPPGKTAVHGLSFDDERNYYDYDVLIGAPTDPDPLHEGYLINGEIDPAYGGDPGTTGKDPGTTPPGGATYDAANDPNLIPVPVRNQPLDLHTVIMPATAPPWDQGAVAYDWVHSPYQHLNYGTGSVSYFLDGPGFVSNTDWNGFDVYNADGKHNSGASGGPSDWNTRGPGSGGDVAVNARSLAQGWGPLVGNPGSATSGDKGQRTGSGSGGPLAGLQKAANGDWFFQSENAPTWATQEADRAIAAYNVEIQKAGAAAVAADNARIAQEAAQAAEDQAKQDAANALALSVADTAGAVALAQQASQQGALDLQQQQREMDFAAAQAALLLKAQQADVTWTIAHPEEAAAQQQAQAEQQAEPEEPQTDEDGFPVDDGGSDEDGVDWGSSRSEM